MGTHILLPAYGSDQWKAPVADEASLPSSGNTTGDARVAIAEASINIWDGAAWQGVSGGGGGGGNSFATIQPDLGTSPAASSGTDTLTLTSTELDITGNSGTDTVTFAMKNASVIAKVLTGFTSGAGTVAATDTILQAFQKIDGNVAAKAPLDSPTFTTKTTHSYSTASRAAAFNSSKELVSATTTLTELNLLSGKTSVGDASGPASSTDNAQARFDGTTGKLLQNGKWIEDDDGHITVALGDSGSTTTRYGVYPTMTLDGGTASSINAYERLDLSTEGSGAGAFVMGRWVRLLAGYTGAGMAVGDWVINNVATNGADLNGGAGAMGYRASMGGAGNYTAGYYATIAATSTRMWGFLAEIDANPSSGTGVGVGGILAAGSSSYVCVPVFGQVGAVGGAPNTSAVAYFNNGTSTHPIILGRDNNTTVFMVKDGGDVLAGTQSIATNATTGFFWLPGAAGAPSGTPSGGVGTMVPFYYDTTNNHLYVYNGGWKKTTVFA